MEAGKFYLIKTDTGGALTGLRVHCLAVYRTHVSLYQMGMHYFVPLSSLTYSELKMPEVGKHYHINGIIDGVSGNINTSNVLETGTFLYFTNQRAIDGVSGHINTDNITEGSINKYFNGKNTSQLPETGTFLYFTNQRAIDGVSGHINTDNVNEGTSNLYFTNQRVINTVSDLSTTHLNFNTSSSIGITAGGDINIGASGNININTNIVFNSGVNFINGTTASSFTIGNSDGITNALFLKNSPDNTKWWRIYPDSNGNLNFDRYNGTAWVTKSQLA